MTGKRARVDERVNGVDVDADMRRKGRLPPCHNALVTALLTDTYQLTMAYAYWKNGTHERSATFELFFRKNPFDGEFTVFAGLEEALRFLSNFAFTEADCAYLRSTSIGANMEGEFFDFLLGLDASKVRVYGQLEGSVVFPRVPLLRLEGPLATVQLFETTLLCLVNYASLVATNAARHRLVAGEDAQLLEFGLRRAQGVDGGISASRYSYLGGFDATSNVEAGRQFGIPIKGTHAHSYVQSHASWSTVKNPKLVSADGSTTCDDFPALVMEKLKQLEALRDDMDLELRWTDTNTSELAAFTTYALAFPGSFLALVDTYNVLKSGLPNFCAVALALRELGYSAVGIRLDSGDLSYLSKQTRSFLQSIERLLGTKIADRLSEVSITASNDIHEAVLYSLRQHGHEIDAFGIGTHLVTCYEQPALGCVYKLVEIDDTPRIKLSEDIAKVTIPGRKKGYRLFSQTGEAIVDVMTRDDEPAPKVGERMLIRHPFEESKRAYVVPSKVEPLFNLVWDREHGTQESLDLTLETSRRRCKESIHQLRADHLRYTNPTPYKVSVSAALYDFIRDLWFAEAPVGELR
ncbi:Nicotinate phosphoribosyltransferase-like [Ostreococcus tauri]|uniref:Nicotinate phosphoribosyltransferase n=1 Tax=Ostreococcus tauri TaxID=70448 RepID=A0A090LXZ4_OSTTA|nr:Nicotinate phosphoribosyltransferase-like [Ostreococcus tauri]CEF96681.1 Nicotinate phosphoribosyltransferase-like [Ostreococcus tauri]|eukprot:XP_003074369.2 Nicotinate phosphoribosyltransferase-like [Ostreococcus tauri]